MLLLGLASGGAASAQEPVETERWYQVELILFLNETAGMVSREEWPRDPGAPDMADAARLETIPEAAAGLIPFQTLPPGELELIPELEKLERSGHYRPLLHTGWRQPFPEGLEEFIPVRIEAPLEPPPESLQPGDSTGQTPATPAEEDPAAAANRPIWSVEQVDEPEPQEGIEGTVRLRVARYLHFDVDLLYRKERPLLPETAAAAQGDGEPASEAAEILNGPAATPGLPFFGDLMADFSGLPRTYFEKYRLTEQRRLRREEIHYFDHPKFGLLVKVAAYEPPEEPPAAAQPAVPQPLPPVSVPDTHRATPQPLD